MTYNFNSSFSVKGMAYLYGVNGNLVFSGTAKMEIYATILYKLNEI